MFARGQLESVIWFCLSCRVLVTENREEQLEKALGEKCKEKCPFLSPKRSTHLLLAITTVSNNYFAQYNQF